MTIDPITLEVVSEGLISIVREMRATVFRTARSVAIFEARDFSCGLFEAKGQVVAQSEDIGSHVVPLPWSVEAAIDDFGDDINPGDVILMNDPYRGGTHLNDVTIIYPVFVEGRLAFFPAVREHWADVGGAVPGSMSGTAREIYQEGMRIPPVKIVEAGRPNQAALEILFSNMRVRDERVGDYESGLTACRTAERRVEAMVDRYGMATIQAVVDANLNRSEARMRERIASLPNGVYHYEDYLEIYDREGLAPLLLPLRLEIAGDTLTADFTGAAPQAPMPVNSTLAVTTASVIITLKSALDPKQALNHGSFRPVTVTAPEGTIVNVSHPAPAGSHGEIRKRVIATMLGALSRACPELVSADIHRTSFHNLIGGVDARTGREYVHYEWSCGGNGGFLEADGPSAMAAIDWGDLCTVQSTEVLEARYPLEIDWMRLAADSGGPGMHRGGLGMRRLLRLASGDASYSLLSDGANVPPFGVLGGEAGAPVASYAVTAAGKRPFETPGKVGGHQVRAGEAVLLQSAGGGGYGDPLDRPADQVFADVAEGYVSAAIARDVYGLRLDKDDALDDGATAVARQALREARRFVELTDLGDRPAYAERGLSRKRLAFLAADLAAALGIGEDDMVELVPPDGAVLRAWARIDPAASATALPIDAHGAMLLGAQIGDRIRIRKLLAVELGDDDEF